MSNIVDPHDKYIVILGPDKPKVSYAYVFINSEINLNVNKTSELLAHQVEITPQNNTFLDHTSYINCAVIKYFDLVELDRELEQNPDYIKGILHQDDHTRVKEIIKDSRIVLPFVKKAYNLS